MVYMIMEDSHRARLLFIVRIDNVAGFLQSVDISDLAWWGRHPSRDEDGEESHNCTEAEDPDDISARLQTA